MSERLERPGAAVVAPEGFVAPGYEAVRDAFVRNFEKRGDVGAAFSAYRNGEIVVDIWGGVADQQTGRTWASDTIALGFSMTKGVTAIVANLLIERGHLDPNVAVGEYWPEFAAGGKASITVAQLLSHQAGLAVIEGAFTLDRALSWTPVVDALAAQSPQWEPGTAHGYHLRSFGWLAGEIVRRCDPKHRTVAAIVREEIAPMLDLDLWIGLPEAMEPRVARLIPPPPENFDIIPRDSDIWRAMTGPDGLFGYNDMWNTRQLHAAELPSSSGIGAARSFAKLYASLVGDGVGGRRLLTTETIDRATKVQCRGADRIIVRDTAFGLGFMLPPTLPMAAGERSFGHGGAGGSTAFADPDRNLACCYVMNALQFDFSRPDLRAETLVRALYSSSDGR